MLCNVLLKSRASKRGTKVKRSVVWILLRTKGERLLLMAMYQIDKLKLTNSTKRKKAKEGGFSHES